MTIDFITKEDSTKILCATSFWNRSIVIISLFMLAACATNKPKIALEIPYYETANEYYQEGANLVRIEDWEGAVGHFSEAIRLNPTLIEVYLLRGLTKYKINDATGAIADLSEVIRLSDDEIVTNEQSLTKLESGLAEEGKVLEFNDFTQGM